MAKKISKEERNTKAAIQYLQYVADASGPYDKAIWDKAFAMVSDDYEVYVLPDSVKMPKMLLPEYRKWIEPMVEANFVEFSVNILETTAQDNRVALELTTSAKTKDGRDYGGEYRISFKFNEDGQITQMKEYVDSLYMMRFYGFIKE